MSDRTDLINFAKREILVPLREQGGSMSKAALHTEIERRFTNGGPLPEALDRVEDKLNRRVASNMIARALSRLVREHIIERTSGRDIVRLSTGHTERADIGGKEGAAPRKRTVQTKAKTAAAARANNDVEAIENSVRRNARAAIRRAQSGGLPYDEDFEEWSIAQVRFQGHRCAAGGVGFDVTYKTDGAGGTHLGPSPDRLDKSKVSRKATSDGSSGRGTALSAKCRLKLRSALPAQQQVMKQNKSPQHRFLDIFQSLRSSSNCSSTL